MLPFKNTAENISKMTVGTGSWRPAAENAIPCVEIEQREEKSQKGCFHKASRKKVQSKTGLKVSNGDSLIRSRNRGRKEEGLVD